MKPPIRLVRDYASKDTEEACRQLLDGASKGKILGLAFVALYKRRMFVVNATGEMRRNPTWARGAVCSLDDELRRLIEGGNGNGNGHLRGQHVKGQG